MHEVLFHTCIICNTFCNMKTVTFKMRSFALFKLSHVPMIRLVTAFIQYLIFFMLPGNAPQGLNALYCGVFYVLKGQTSRNLGAVNTQTDLHWPRSSHRWSREAHNLWLGPPGEITKREIYSCLWLWLPTQCCSGRLHVTMRITVRGEDSL